MARYIYQKHFLDRSGNVISSGVATIYNANSTVLATCYSSSGGSTVITNSQITTGADGFFKFWVDTTDYTTSSNKFKIALSKTNFTSQTYDDIEIIPNIYDLLQNLNYAVNEAKGSDISSSGTTNIGTATGNFVVVTGTATITALGTAQAGARRIVNFSGAATLTHNATSLILPSGADITTANGDVAVFVSLGSGNWRCVSYLRADGTTVGKRPSFAVHKNGTNQGSVDTSATLVTWSTEDFDSNGNFASNTFTPTVAGKYLLSAVIRQTTAADTGTGQIHIYKNGSLHRSGAKFHASTNTEIAMGVVAVVDANGTTDAFTIYIEQGFVNPATIDGTATKTWFTGCKID